MTDHSDLIARLRAHVRDRGGMSRDAETGEIVLPNGAWAMMLAAADALSSQSLSLSEARAERDSFRLKAATAEGQLAAALDRASSAEQDGTRYLTRAEIAERERDEAKAEIERLKKLSDRYGVALMMIRAGCSDPARFAGNILDDREPVNVELDEEDFDENHR